MIIRNDAAGLGHYGARRKDAAGKVYEHNGIDIRGFLFDVVPSFTPGEVTKLGYMYSSDLSYRYVQVSHGPYDFRYGYVFPDAGLQVGDKITVGHYLGKMQKISVKFEDMYDHVHFNIKKDGEYVDPSEVLQWLKYLK